MCFIQINVRGIKKALVVYGSDLKPQETLNVVEKEMIKVTSNLQLFCLAINVVPLLYKMSR